MRIALLCFGVGTIANIAGTEKVFVTMANAFCDRGHQVWAVWNDEPGVKPFYPFREGVHPLNLGLGKIKVPFFYKLQREINKGLHRSAENKVDAYKTKKLTETLRKNWDTIRPDCIVCYEFNSVMVANILSGGKIPVAVMVHNSVDDQIGKLTPLQRKEEGKADVYQVPMPSFVKEAEQLLTNRIVYIPHVVPQIPDGETARPGEKKERYSIVHIGRVEGRQKRQLILAQSFAALAEKYPDWDLDLYGPVGDEAYKNQLMEFIKEKQLKDRIRYQGITERPEEVLRQADIFAFPSSYEAFGLALAEAMSMGLPAVGFKEAPAVGELIVHQQNGLLAADEEDFTRQLDRLMGDRQLRAQLGAGAHKAMKKFAPETVWSQWEDLLEELCRNKNRAQ